MAILGQNMMDMGRTKKLKGVVSFCWAVHWAVGCEVTLKCATLRRLWQRITRTNKILKATVGTMKKSIEHLFA